MKQAFLLSILGLILASFSHGQNRKFLIHVNKSDPFLYEPVEASSARINHEKLDRDRVSSMMIRKINSSLQSKLRSELVQDSILNMISRSGIETYTSSRYSSSKNWQREYRSIDYAIKLSGSKYRMFAAYAIKIDILDLDWKLKFYCDRRNNDSDLLLYEGNPPKIRDPEHENYVDPVPLQCRTEEGLMNEFLQVISKNGCMRNILSRQFSRIGVDVKVEEKSLYRSRRPFMYAVIIIAGKQNNHMKKKDKIQRLTELEERYE